MSTSSGTNEGSFDDTQFKPRPAVSTFATAALGRLTVAQLSLVGKEGDEAFATNGLKIGDTPGAGTGVPVYFSGGQWRNKSNDAAVSA